MHIALLFTAFVTHGTIPDCFISCTIVPIPKGCNVNTTESSNFRGIALSSVLGKLFDNIILERYSNQLSSSDLQFGFKSNSSTNMCSMVLKETINYYNHSQTPVFCTFLDATKAFDRVHYCKLIRLLVKRKLPGIIVRALVGLYTNNLVRVSWCGFLSDYFSVVNGVKQGAVLSPVLFCVYIDDLLISLSKAGVGCYVGPFFVGALAYADDVVIIAPTPTAMRKLLSVCEDYACEYHISFNALKSKCLVVVPRSKRFMVEYLKDCTFYVQGKPIEFVKSFSHLGHIINVNLTDDEDIIHRRTNFVGQTNNMLCYFRKLDSFTKYRLFQSYCTSFYGCELWLLNNSYITDYFSVAWRKGVRQIWQLPARTHCYLLPLLCRCLPLLDEFCRRSLNFARSCIGTSCSSLVNFIASHGIFHGRSFSTLGQNVSFCTNRYKCTIGDVLSRSAAAFINSFVIGEMDDDMRSSGNFLIELMMIKSELLQLSDGIVFDINEYNDIIEFVCTQ